MANIQDITEAWQGHTGLEVETFVKQQLVLLAASLGGKFGHVEFNSQTMTISFYDEPGGTVLGSVQLGGQVYTISAACNLPQVFFVLADETEKIMTLTPSTTVSTFGSQVTDPFPEPYTFVVSVNSGDGYIDRVTGNIDTGGTASFDIRPFLSIGDNYIRVAITGTSSGQTKTSVFTGTLTTLTMSCSHTWQNVWTQGQDYNITGIRFAGNLIKQLHVMVDNVEVPNSPVTYSASQSYTTTATYFTIPASAFPAGGSGVHSIKLWMTAQGVSTPQISYNIMCAVEGDSTPLVAINSIEDRVYNFTSSTLFAYAVYNANKVSIDMSATLNSVNYVVASGVVIVDREEGVQYPFAYALEVDTGANETKIGSIAFSAKAYQNSVEGVTSTASSIFDNTYSYLATPGALFYINAATRDNGSANRLLIVNEAGASENFAATYNATWSGLSWHTDGWGNDPLGNKALNIPAGCSVVVDDFTPLSLFSTYDGMSFEFMIQSGSPSDYDTPVISLASGGDTTLGIIIYPTRIVVWGSSERDRDFQTVNLAENTITHICITFLKGFEGNPGKNICSVYVNGISNVNFAFDGSSNFGTGRLEIGQAHTDVYLYKMRVYGVALESRDVLNNFLNSVIDGIEFSRSQLNKSNDVLLGSVVSYEMVKQAGYNTMVITTPNNASIPAFYNQVTLKDCSVRFEYAGQRSKNATISHVSMDGQGTTSKKYYRWNLRWKTSDITTWVYGDGTSDVPGKSGRMINDLNYIKVDRITAKKNIASSPQGHKMGLTGLYNDLFHQIGLGVELPEPDTRVAVYQFPFVGFQYNTQNQSYEFIGIYTVGPDKGSKVTFSYLKNQFPDCLSIEGPNHAPRGTRFLCPWVDVKYDPNEETLTFGGEEGWDCDYVKYETSTKGTQADWDAILNLYNTEWQPAYNCVYDNSPYLASSDEVITALADENIQSLSDLLTVENAPIVKAGVTNGMIVKNEFIAIYVSEPTIIDEVLYNKYDLLFYRRVAGCFTRLPESYLGYKNALSDLSVYLSAIGASTTDPTTAQIVQARAARFKATMMNYFSREQTLYHYCFCLLFGVTDNFAKNSYPFKFQLLSSEGVGNRWGWRQDDLDSVLMTDNNGTNTKSYSVEHLDTVNGVQLFQGGDSALWVLIKNNYENECRTMMGQIASAAAAIATELNIPGSGLHESLFNITSYYCWEHSAKYFPATLYESDRRWSYIEPWLLAGSAIPGSGETYPSTYNGVAPLTQALGDQYQGERLWMYRRIAYIFSKYHIGAFHGTQTGYNAIVFTLAESFTFHLTPAIDLYPVVSLVDDDVVGGRTFAGNSVDLPISTTGDSNNSIHGGDWLSSLGDLSGMRLTSRGGSSSIEFSVTGARLQTLKIGDAVPTVRISEAVYYTAAEAAEYNNLLSGAISAGTALTAEQATLVNTAISTSYAEGDTLSENDAIAYNETLQGAVTTSDVKTPEVWGVPFNATVFGVTSAALVSIDARNTATITNTVDLLGCPRLRTCLFEGSGAAGLYLPVGAKLTEVSFPASANTIFMHSLPFLESENVVWPDLSGVVNLYINNCESLNPFSVVTSILAIRSNKLAFVTLVWSGLTMTNSTTIRALTGLAGYVAFENNRPTTVGGKPYVEGSVQLPDLFVDDFESFDIVSVEDYGEGLKRALSNLFGTNFYIVYDPNKLWIRFADAAVKAVCVANWDTNSDGEVDLTEAGVVTSINYAFAANTAIEYFEELKYFTGLRTIGVNTTSRTMFSGCTNLKRVDLPEGLTKVSGTSGSGTYVNSVPFYQCSSLERIAFPNTLTTLGGDATHAWCFTGCTHLSRVDIKDLSKYLNLTIYGIQSSPFYASTVTSRGLYLNGELITHLVIPVGRTTIKAYLFYNNTTIQTLTIPTSLSSDATEVFTGCTNLQRINFSDLTAFLNIAWSSHPFVSRSSGGTIWLNGEQVTSVVIPTNITSIKAYALYRTNGLTSVTIHNSVTSIGASAFFGCGGLTDIAIPDSVTSIGASAFRYSGLNGSIVLQNVTSVGANAFANISITSFTNAASSSYGSEAFLSCTNLSTIDIVVSSVSFTPFQKVGKSEKPITLIIRGNFSGGGNWGTAYIKKIVITGNVNSSLGTYIEGVQEFRVGGNITAGAGSMGLYYSSASTKFFECMGAVYNSSGNSFFYGSYAMVVHLGYNGVVAARPSMFKLHANTKVYVGPGESQAGDEAVLELYRQDADWGQYVTSGKVLTWWSYSGQYKE